MESNIPIIYLYSVWGATLLVFLVACYFINMIYQNNQELKGIRVTLEKLLLHMRLTQPADPSLQALVKVYGDSER